MSFQKILVALDQSTQAATVFAEAIALAQAHHGSLKLLHCVLNDIVAQPIGLSEQFGVSPHLFEQAYQTQTAQLERQVNHAVSLLRHYQAEAARQGISAEFDYKVSEPGPTICRVAQQWSADLIVMGRRGRSGLAEALLGSVSNYVLHHAACSVFVVQTPQQTQATVAQAANPVSRGSTAQRD